MALKGTKPMTNIDWILPILRNLPIDFHLTGSHAFGWADYQSDMDFFAQDDQNTRAALIKYGFQLVISNHDYMDKQTVAVWRAGDQHGPDHVDVQLVRDYKIKRDAQMWLLNNQPWRNALRKPAPQAKRKAIWNMAYEKVK